MNRKEKLELVEEILHTGKQAAHKWGSSNQDRKAVEEACEFGAAMQRGVVDDICEEAADVLITILPLLDRYNGWHWVEEKLARLENRIGGEVEEA